MDYAHPNVAEGATKGSGITPQSTTSAGKGSANTPTDQGKTVKTESEGEKSGNNGENITKSGTNGGEKHIGDTNEKIAQAEQEVNTEPTEKQKEAGNYKKGHVKVDGYDISIEQPKGSVRRGTDADGNEWSTTMHNTYGYIRGTEGVDGDHIDVFLSDNPEQGNVYVIDQVDPKTGKFDEHKVMYGFNSIGEAEDAYLSNYEKGWKGLGNITEVSKDEFKKWVDSSHRKTKPFAEYKSVKPTAMAGYSAESAKPTQTTIEGLRKEHEEAQLAVLRTWGDVQKAGAVFKKAHQDYQEALKGGDAKAIEKAKKDISKAGLDLYKAISSLDFTNIENTASSFATYRHAYDEVKRSKKYDGKVNLRAETMADILKEILINKGVDKRVFGTKAARVKLAKETEDARTLRLLAQCEPEVLEAVINNPHADNVTLATVNPSFQYDAEKKLRERGVQFSKSDETRIPTEEQRHLGEAVVQIGRDVGLDISTDVDEMRKKLEESVNDIQRAATEQASRHFEEQLSAFEKGEMRPEEQFSLGSPSPTLLAAGLPAAEFTMTQKVLRTHMQKHDLSANDVRGLVEAMQEPMMVYEWGSKAKSHVIITNTETKDGRKIAVAVRVAEDGSVQEVNKIASVHGKSVERMLSDMNTDKTDFGIDNLRYVDKEKALDWLGFRAPLAHTPSNQELISAAKVIKDFENPKVSTEILQKMTAFHGSPHSFDHFDHSHMGEGEGLQVHGWGTYVAKDKSVSINRYALRLKPKPYYEYKHIDEIPETAYSPSWGRWSPRGIIKNIASSRMYSSKTLDEIKSEVTEYYGSLALYDEQFQTLISSLKEDDFELVNPKTNLYEVEIPDDTGSNYLDEDKPVSKEAQKRIINQILSDEEVRDRLEQKVAEKIQYDTQRQLAGLTGNAKSLLLHTGHLTDKELKDEIKRYKLIPTENGRQLYSWLTYRLGSDKSASQFFNKAGFAGIRYVGAVDGECYVIFDEKDLKIKSHHQFLKTKDGEVYGFTIDGKIYIDPSLMNPNTPIHEYTHLWDYAVRKSNPKLWERGKELMKQLPLWEEVKNDPAYSDIAHDEDLLASEVHSRLSGEEGARLLDQMIKEARAKGDPINLAKTITLVGRIKQWIKDVLAHVRDAFSGKWGDKELASMTIDEFAKMPVKDLLAKGFNPNKVAGEDIERHIQYSKVTDEDLKKKLEAEPKVKVYRAMQVIDGKLYPPMATRIKGEDGKKHLVQPITLGEWEQADERPELVKNGKFTLDKANGTSLDAAYNPYIHTSRSPLNDQFSSAYKRPNLVTVEVEVPESELTSGYKAEGAKDAVGEMDWHSGPVSSQLAKAGDPRKVILTRYDKPVRIIPDTEVADRIAEKLHAAEEKTGKPISIPANTITPSLRKELEKRGVNVSDNKDSEVQKSIVEQAKKNGTYMKAPNGKPSKLTPKQWAQTRTKAFKIWFGDWEKDPDNASKVVDENGEPLVVYHGTPNGGFTIFDNGKGNIRKYSIEHINFFARSKDTATRYTKNGDYPQLYGVFLNLRNPDYDNFEGLDWNGQSRSRTRLKVLYPIMIGDTYYVKGDYVERPDGKGTFFDSTDDAIKYLKKKHLYDEENLGFGIETDVNTGRTTNTVADDARKKGYDGAIIEDVFDGGKKPTTVYAAFSPNQIKSATDNNGKFSTEDEDIRFRLGDEPDTFEERQKRAVEGKGTVMSGLNEAEVKVVDVPRHEYKGDIKSATKQASEAAKAKFVPNGKPKPQHYDNHGAQFDYDISSNAIDESLNPKQAAKSDNKGAHLAVIEHLDEVINESIEVEEHPDYTKTDGVRTTENVNPNNIMHRFVGAVNIDGQTFRVSTLMRESNEPAKGNGVHSYEVIKVEVLEDESPSTSSGVGSNASTQASYPLAKLLQNVEKSYDKGVKLLDASEKKDNNGDISTRNREVKTFEDAKPWTTKAAVERKTAHAQAVVNDYAKRLHLDNVEVVTDTSQLKGNRAKAKGIFDVKTGKITIVLPNHTDVQDVVRTILHEGVAHYGLRKLFGEENFNTVLDNIYNNVREDIGSRIDSMAEKIKAQAKQGGKTASDESARREATEEYLAGLAEDTDFERLEVSTWQKIKAIVIDALAKIGINLKEKLTDNELRYLLWRSYQNMKEPGRYRNPIDTARDVVMQDKLGVGNYRKSEERRVKSEELAAEGDFAAEPSPTDNIRNGIAALRKIANGAESVPDAMRRDDLTAYGGTNGITFYFGKTGNPDKMFKGGFGISHIGAKHGTETLMHLLDVIANGEIRRYVEGNKTVVLGKGDYEVVLALTKNGNSETWMLTGWNTDETKEKAGAIGEVSTQSVATQTNPTFSREDLGAAISAANISKYFENPSVSEEIFSDNDENLRFRQIDDDERRLWRDVYDEATSGLKFKFTEAGVDGMHSVTKLMETIAKETGMKIEEAEDVWGHFNHLSSKNKIEEEYYTKNFFEPIEKACRNLVKLGAKYTEGKDIISDDNNILKYIIAKHGLERNEVLAQRDYDAYVQAHPNTTKTLADFRVRDYSGLSELFDFDKQGIDYEAEAQDYVDRFENDYPTADLWDAINNATDETLRKQYESGLCSKDYYDKVKDMFCFYVPLRDWEIDAADSHYNYKHGSGTGGSLLKRAKGRTSLAANPIAMIGSKGQNTILQANKNMAKRSLYELAMNHDSALLTVRRQWYQNIGTADDPVWERVYPNLTEDMTADEVDAELKDFEKRMRDLKDIGMARNSSKGLQLGYHNTKGQAQQHRVNVSVGGKEYNIFVNGNPRAAQAINGELRIEDDENSIVERVKRHLSSVYTSLNPEFVVTNYERDAGFAAAIVAATEPAKYQAGWAKNMTMFNPLTSGVYLNHLINKVMSGKADPNSKYETYMKEFLFNGGETGYTNMLTVNDYKKLIKRSVKRINAPLSPKEAGQVLSGAVERANRVFEDATRFATYVTSREQGRSVFESVKNAKEISLNFNTRGADGMKGDGGWYRFFRNLRRYFIFVNPSIQGLAKAGRAFQTHPVRSAAFLLGAPALLGFSMATIAGMLLGGDGDDDEATAAYKDLPKWVRRTNICLPVGGTKFVTIPLSYELRVSYGLGEMLWETQNGMVDSDEVAIETLTQLSDLLPISFMSGTPEQNLSPSMVRPFVEIWQNSDFQGKQIYSDNSFNKNMPQYTKCYAGTSKWIVKSMEMLNDATGGDKYTKGWVEQVVDKAKLGIYMNPGSIEHLLNSYAGGIFTMPNKMWKSYQGWVMGDEDMKDIRNLPFVSRNLRDSKSGNPSSKGQGSRYYDYMREYRVTKDRYDGYCREKRHGVTEFVPKLTKFLDTPEGKRMQKIDDYKKSKGLDRKEREIKEIDQYGGDKAERERLANEVSKLKEQMVRELDAMSEE